LIAEGGIFFVACCGSPEEARSRGTISSTLTCNNHIFIFSVTCVKVINILSKNPARQGKIENKVKNIENIEDGLLVVTYPSND
jgi:hypothetical protein